MSRRSWNITLAGLLGASIVASVFGPDNSKRRNFEYFPDMARSPRYNTFAPNPNFADGKTLQAPVPGTVPIEDPWRAGEPRAGDAEPQAISDPNPFTSADAAAMARGQAVFTTFCQPCHGASGDGNGIVTEHGFSPTPSLTAGIAVMAADAMLFRIVTRGMGHMPPYASQIAPSDRWKVILYVRSLQQRAKAGAGKRNGG